MSNLQGQLVTKYCLTLNFVHLVKKQRWSYHSKVRSYLKGKQNV